MPKKSEGALLTESAAVVIEAEPVTVVESVEATRRYRVMPDEGLNRWEQGTLLSAAELGVPPPTLAYLIEVGVLTVEEESGHEGARNRAEP